MADRFCILRTGGAKTLRLADSLSACGFEAWTPRETIKRRSPRRRSTDDLDAPIMPTFVFAPADHLAELITLAQAFTKPTPDFSVQRYFDRFPLIASAELDPLRTAERKGTPLHKVKQLAPGERVRLTEGGFNGMSGIVQTSDGRFTMVCFPGFSIPIKIATLILLTESATCPDDIAA